MAEHNEAIDFIRVKANIFYGSAIQVIFSQNNIKREYIITLLQYLHESLLYLPTADLF